MSTRPAPNTRAALNARTPFQLDFSFSCACLIALLCAAYVWQPLQGGEDFWAHAAIGRWICENGRVPTQTLWLWSTPPQPWVAHSWLYEVVLYLLMRYGGAHLVLLVTAVLVALPFLWAWRLWRERGGSLVFGALFFALSIGCAAARFQPRPELITYFFLSILLLFLIHRSTSEERPQPLVKQRFDAKQWSIVAMFALWANCHGAVALGLAVLVMTLLCEVAQYRNVHRAWPLLRLTVLCAAAITFNPYGLRYWTALRQVGGDMFSMIDEWKSALTPPALPPIAIALVLVVAAIALLSWLGNRAPESGPPRDSQNDSEITVQSTPRCWAQLAWLVFFTLLFFMARRNLWPVMLVAVFVAAANARSLRGATLLATLLPSFASSRRARLVARAVTAALLLASILSALSPELLAHDKNGASIRAVSQFAPTGVARYVLTQHPPDPIFNDYLRSSYFSWAFGGRRELYIDVHNAYPPQLLREYFDIIARTPEGIERFEKRKIKTVIFGRWDARVGRLAPIAKYLSHSPEWKQEYSGVDGAVWVRKSKLSSRSQQVYEETGQSSR